jgi:peptidoglycan/LPS O-acetylase OafA/YrhL
MAAEIKPLTSIRGIAAVLVVIYHFHQNDVMPFALLGSLLRKGYFWVDLFFVLSGFVMALTSASMFADGYHWQTHKEFLLKRIARIYPLYFALTVAVSLYSLAIYGGYSNVHRPAVNLDHPLVAHVTNLLMIHGWGFGSSIGGPTWSISTEWAAYLLFPLLMYCALNAGKAVAGALWGGAIALLVYVATHVEAGQAVRNGQFDIYHCMDQLAVMRCLGGFSIGLLAFRLRRVAALMTVLSLDGVCIGLFIAILGMMALGLDDLWIYPLLPLLVLSLSGVKGLALRVFSWPPFYGLGVLSYSIYLLHVHFHVVLQQLQQRLPHFVPVAIAPWLAVGITYGTILGCALFCYRFIEKPGRTWLRQRSVSPPVVLKTE